MSAVLFYAVAVIGFASTLLAAVLLWRELRCDGALLDEWEARGPLYPAPIDRARPKSARGRGERAA